MLRHKSILFSFPTQPQHLSRFLLIYKNRGIANTAQSVDFNHCKIIAAAATDDSEEKSDETLAKNDEL